MHFDEAVGRRLTELAVDQKRHFVYAGRGAADVPHNKTLIKIWSVGANSQKATREGRVAAIVEGKPVTYKSAHVAIKVTEIELIRLNARREQNYVIVAAFLRETLTCVAKCP